MSLRRTRFVVVALALAVTASCTHVKTKKGGKRLGGKRAPTVAAVDGTTTTTTPETTPPEAAPPKLITSETVIELVAKAPVDGGGSKDLPVKLNARVVAPEGEQGPVVVIVPGGSDISKEGTRKGDGVVVYPVPVDVGSAFSRAFAERGAVAFSYDKRTCGPNDVASCNKNPQDDVDALGPVALAQDVDAACAVARALPSYDGHLILWAHGQAAQVALSSTCAKEASAIVVLSPIPRGVDEVIVDAFGDRQQQALAKAKTLPAGPEKDALAEQAAGLKNLAGTKAAEFAAMKGGKFAKDSRVGGATVAFWQGWISLTQKTPALFEAVKDKLVVVVGTSDLQLSAKDRTTATKLPAKAVVTVDADHHLLTNAELDDGVVKAIADAIDDVLGDPQS